MARRSDQVPDALFIQNEVALKYYDKKNATLVSSADYLVMLFKDDLVMDKEATSLRDRVLG